MTLRKRRIYFIICVVIFAAAVPAVILYSQGYTFNFASFSLEKTGAIFISTSPKGVRISVEGELAAITSDLIFSQGKLLSHLVPTTYQILVEKPNYQPWTKKLAVEPQLVTEARNIFLVPKNVSPLTIDENVSDVILSDSNAMITYITGDGAAILDVSSPKIVPLTAQEGEKIGKVRFGADENYLLVESFIRNEVKKYLRDLRTGETIEIREEDPDRFIKLRQYPVGEPRVIALSTDKMLYGVNLRSQNEKTTIATNVVNFELFGGKVLYATAEPTLFYEKDLATGRTDQLHREPLKGVDFSSTILRSPGGYIAYLDNAKNLYLYNHDDKTFTRIAQGVLAASFSDDNRKLMWRTKNEIHVYYLRNVLIQPRKKQGDTELITRFSEPIGAAAWFSYDNEHILFVTDGMLKFVELDGRDVRNVYDITPVAKPAKLMYNSFDDFIYLLDGKTLKKLTLIRNG